MVDSPSNSGERKLGSVYHVFEAKFPVAALGLWREILRAPRPQVQEKSVPSPPCPRSHGKQEGITGKERRLRGRKGRKEGNRDRKPNRKGGMTGKKETKKERGFARNEG